MVDRSNTRVHSASSSGRINLNGKGEDSESKHDVEHVDEAAESQPGQSSNDCESGEGGSIGYHSSVTQESGEASANDDRGASSDTDPLNGDSDCIHDLSAPTLRRSISDTNMKERSLLHIPASPVTQTYDFAGSLRVSTDAGATDFYGLKVGGSSASPEQDIFEDQFLSLSSTRIHEDLAGLEISDTAMYLEEIEIALAEVNDSVCDNLSSKHDKDVVHYLWFSAPQNIGQTDGPAVSQAGKTRQRLDREEMINTWLLVCLVRQRMLNIEFASRLYRWRFKDSTNNPHTSVDLTEEARIHWYDHTTPLEPLLDFPREFCSSKKATETEDDNVNVGAWDYTGQDMHIESAHYEPEDDERQESKPMPDLVYRCKVYGCSKQFGNISLLRDHLDVGNHSFLCPEIACERFTFCSHQEYQNHISFRHQDQEWKLFRLPDESAELNSDFDNRQNASGSEMWNDGTAPARPRVNSFQAWD